MCHLSHLAKTCGSSIFRKKKKKTWIKIDSPEFLERNQHGNFGYQPHGTYIPYDDSEGTSGSTASLEVPKKNMDASTKGRGGTFPFLVRLINFIVKSE